MSPEHTDDLDGEARYCYCLVAVDGEGSGEAADGTELDAAGVDDETPYLVVVDGVAAVVHACETLYEAADPLAVKRLLVRHQGVVDAAGEAHGTPLPFRFDVAIEGDDEAVREWLRENYDEVAAAIEDLADHWEYRIGLRWDPAVADDGEELAAVEAKLAEAGPGKRYLLEKQREQLVRERRRERRRELAARLESLIDPVVSEYTRQSLSGRIGIGDGGDGDTGESRSADTADGAAGDTGAEPTGAATDDDGHVDVAGYAVLAHASREGDLGDALDDIAAEPGVEIRFTGPWPPYSFAPSFEED